MSSIKCSTCNLVNFSAATHCKRCQQPLNEFSGIAAERPYQSNTQFQTFQTPPPPPVFQEGGGVYQPQPNRQPLLCIKCAGRQNVNLQNFKKDYVPPVAYLGAFIGILPMLILVLCLKVRHKLSAPFCDRCWQKFGTARAVSTLASLGFLVGIVLAVIAMIAFDTGFAFLMVFAVTAGLCIWAGIYVRQNSPKFKKVTRQQVIINTAGMGEICFEQNWGQVQKW